MPSSSGEKARKPLRCNGSCPYKRESTRLLAVVAREREARLSLESRSKNLRGELLKAAARCRRLSRLVENLTVRVLRYREQLALVRQAEKAMEVAAQEEAEEDGLVQSDY